MGTIAGFRRMVPYYYLKGKSGSGGGAGGGYNNSDSDEEYDEEYIRSITGK